MASVPDYQEVECKTIDGTIIRGWFYAVEGPAPVIIMTPGLNCVKRILLPQVAKEFQSNGYNAFIYDPRSIGDSDGLPRNQIDPLLYAEDLSDIVTQISALPTVDAKRIVLWGMSFGGTVSGCAAVVDRRVKALIMVCPILTFYKAEKRENAFARLIKDRESQLAGNPPEMVHTFNSKGDNLIGMAGDGGPGGLEAFWFMNLIVERGGPSARDHITLASNHKLAMFRPREILAMLDKTPVMMIIPELDAISPPELQKEVFDKFSQTKKVFIAKGKGHLNVISGKGSDEVVREQVEFLKATIEGVSSKL